MVNGSICGVYVYVSGMGWMARFAGLLNATCIEVCVVERGSKETSHKLYTGEDSDRDLLLPPVPPLILRNSLDNNKASSSVV